MLRRQLVLLSLALTLPASNLSAQVILVVPAAAALDRDAYVFAIEHQSRTLDRLADAVDPLGRARYLVPAMAGAYVTARVAGNRRWSQALVRIGIGYAAADIIESVLKPTVGRHRRDSSRRPWRFRPFNAKGDWHSFPSAHTVHAFRAGDGHRRRGRQPLGLGRDLYRRLGCWFTESVHGIPLVE
jgi:hypothetical protein